MPTYEYKCADCGHQMEVFARMSDPAPEACDECGGTELTKVLFPVAVHYKGSGFYSTDYAGKKRDASSSSLSSGGSDAAPTSSDSTTAPSTPPATPPASSPSSD